MLISLASFETLSKNIERLNKRLSKKNLPLITYTSEKEVRSFGELFSESVIERHEYDPSWGVEVVNFNLTSDVRNWIIESGYEIVAYIDHKEKMVHEFIEGVNVEEYRERCVCDHCHTNRKRTKSVILRDKSGKFIQVGTTCISDFIKSDVDELVKALALSVEDFQISENEEGYFFNAHRNGNVHYNLYAAIPVIYRDIKKRGSYYYANKDKSVKESAYKTLIYRANLNITENEKRIASNIIDWMSSLKNTSTLKGNLKQIAKNGYVSYKSLGYLCSGVDAFICGPNKKHGFGDFIGKKGDEVSVEVTFSYIKVRDYNMFGQDENKTYTFCGFDSDGNEFMWNASSDFGYKVGDKGSITGIVNSHSEAYGNKCNHLDDVTFNK